MDQNGTIEEQQTKQAIFIVSAAVDLAGKTGVPLSILTRELAAAAAAGQVKLLGPKMAARCFRDLADKIESGAFDLAGGDSIRPH